VDLARKKAPDLWHYPILPRRAFTWEPFDTMLGRNSEAPTMRPVFHQVIMKLFWKQACRCKGKCIEEYAKMREDGKP